MEEDEFLSHEESEIPEESEESEEESEEEDKLYDESVYETLKNPKKYLQDYEKYWQGIYGVDPSLSERAKAFREAEMRRKGGPEKIRAERLSELQQKVESRKLSPTAAAARNLQEKYSAHRCKKPCENLTEEQRRRSSPSETIRLQVADREKNVHCVCYDIFKLYAYLRANHGPDPFDWRDPTYKTALNSTNQRKIKQLLEKTEPCLSRLRKLTVQGSDKDGLTLPLSLFQELSHETPKINYFMFRISNRQGDYSYEVGSGFHKREDAIGLSQRIQGDLKVKPGDSVWLQDCYRLRPVQLITLQPLTEEWNKVPESALEQIKDQLTRALEKDYTVSIGDSITIPYTLPSGGHPVLFVSDVKSNGRRVPVGISKNAEVKVDFKPFSPEGRIYW